MTMAKCEGVNTSWFGCRGACQRASKERDWQSARWPNGRASLNSTTLLCRSMRWHTSSLATFSST